MSIDWSKAPDWAVAHGLHETGFGIKEFWLGETQHQNLEHAKSFPYGGGDPSCGSFHNSRRASFSYVTPRPAPWTGEGLPPIGTVCDFAGFNPEETMPTDPRVGDQVTVIAHFMSGSFEVAAFTFYAPPEFEYLQVAKGAYGCFRPTRTPEQIAADEREAGITKMRELVGSLNTHPFSELWDAGYRKQPSP